jgi:hypothetical protein
MGGAAFGGLTCPLYIMTYRWAKQKCGIKDFIAVGCNYTPVLRFLTLPYESLEMNTTV